MPAITYGAIRSAFLILHAIESILSLPFLFNKQETGPMDQIPSPVLDTTTSSAIASSFLLDKTTRREGEVLSLRRCLIPR